MKIKKNLLSRLLFPDRCLVCRRFLPSGYICEDCRENLSNPLAEIQYTVDGQENVSFVLSPEYYEDSYRKSIESFKFNGAYKLSSAFAGLMCDSFECVLGEDLSSYNVICYVPMSSRAKRKRGYNQAEKLAVSVSALCGVAVKELIVKAGQNLTQHSLNAKDRKQNVKGVYSVLNPKEVKGKRIILIDDIITTGATLSECLSLLYSCGADKVQCLCAARTDEHS